MIEKFTDLEYIKNSKILQFVKGEIDSAINEQINCESSLNHIFDNVMFDCSTCNLKEICDEVDGLKELHLKNVKK